MNCIPPLLCHFYLVIFEVPHARKDLSSCLTRLLIWKLRLPLPPPLWGFTRWLHQRRSPRMSSQGPLGGLAAAGSSEPRWLATAVGRREWPPQVLPDAHCTSRTAQNASPGPCFCLCSAPQNWAPSVTLLLPGALLLCPATRLHYFTSTQMCCVVLRIPWR